MTSSGNIVSDGISDKHNSELKNETGVTLHHLPRPTGNLDHIRRDFIAFSSQSFSIVRTVLVKKGVANRRGAVIMTGLKGHPIALIRRHGATSRATIGENAIVTTGVKTPCVREI